MDNGATLGYSVAPTAFRPERGKIVVTYEVFAGVLSSFLVVVAGAFFWLMSELRAMRRENREVNETTRRESREDNRALREELLAAIRTESEARRADTQRILEAIYFHRHDPDGTVALRPPTQQAAD